MDHTQNHTDTTEPRSLSRRSLTTGIAWSVPAVAVVSAAPAMAASLPENWRYRFRGSLHVQQSRNTTSGTGGYNEAFGQSGDPLTSLSIDNTTPTGSSPLGFSVVHQPRLDDPTQLSPQTVATIEEPIELVVAYPKGMVDTASGSFFTFESGSQNYAAPTHQVQRLTTAGGVTTDFDVFRFRWLGSQPQPTQADVTSGGRPQSWTGTTFSGTWKHNPKYFTFEGIPYYTNYHAGGYVSASDRGTFVTGNGYSNVLPTNPNGGWSVLPV